MDVIECFNWVRDIPYKLPLEFEEPDYCCQGKHEILEKLLSQKGLKVRPRLCENKWSHFTPLPREILAIPHDDDVCHVYLEFQRNHKWYPIDASIDSALGINFPVFEWDGKTSTEICINPLKIYTPKKSRLYYHLKMDKEQFERDININGEFYSAVNEFLDKTRRENKTL